MREMVTTTQDERLQAIAAQHNDWQNEWSGFGETVYLNTAAHAALPRRTVAAVQESLSAKSAPQKMDDSCYFEVPQRIRAALARLLRARPEELVLTTGATTGLAMLALSMRWRQDDEVLSAVGEFPTQYATWKPMEARAGIRFSMVKPRERYLTARDVIEAITPQTRVISLSHVRFDDGTLLDTSAISAICRERNILFVLDVSQSCGAVPMEVHELGADMLVCAGYKWLLGPTGSGFAWMNPRLIEALPPGPFNWSGQVEREFASLDMVTPQPTTEARRWDAAESASYFNLNLSAMATSVEFVESLPRGIVTEHGRALIDHLFRSLPPGFHPASPLDSSARGSYGCFQAADREKTVQAYEWLRSNNIVVSLREGRIRVSPYLFNSAKEIDRLVETLEAVR